MASLRTALESGAVSIDDAWLEDGRLSDLVHGLAGRQEFSNVDEWLEIALDPATQDILAYGAFIGATTIERRRRNYEAFEAIVDDPILRSRFSESTNHLISAGHEMHRAEAMMYSLRRGERGSWDEALYKAEENLKYFERHHGAHNLITEICLGSLSQQPKQPHLIDRADRANKRSLDLARGSKPKYLVHAGVIRAYRGDPVLGEMLIHQAICTEDCTRWDYSAVVAEYQGALTLTKAVQISSEMSENLAESRLAIEESRGQLLTLTGLLAAVVAIVIVNAGIAQNFTNRADALALMFASTGTIAVVFGLLIGLILTPRRRAQWIMLALVIGIGLLLMVIGLFSTDAIV